MHTNFDSNYHNELAAEIKAYHQRVNALLQPPNNLMTKFFKSLLNEINYSGQYNSVYANGVILFAVAEASQGKIQVRLPNGTTTGLNIFIEQIGPPGTGKTRTTDFILKGNYEYEMERKRRFRTEKDNSIAEKAKLRLIKKDIERKYSLKSTTAGEKEKLQEDIKIISLALSRVWPRDCSRMINSATLSGITERLNENEGHLTLIVTEGMDFFKNEIANNLSFFLELYDNKGYSRATKESGLIMIDKVFFNMMISLTNEAACKQHAKNAERWSESGFLSRLYPIIYTKSLDGGLANTDNNPKENYNKFLGHIRDIYLRSDHSTNDVLEVSDETNELIKNWVDNYRQQATYSDSANFLARIELHIMKLAGIIALLENPKVKEISLTVANAASELVEYFFHMHHILETEEALINGDGIKKDAASILKTILEHSDISHTKCVHTSWIVARAPAHRRCVRQLRPVLDYLELTKKIRRSDCYKNAYFLAY